MSEHIDTELILSFEDIEYPSFVFYIVNDGVYEHGFMVGVHDLPAVALTMMKIQIAQEASES